MKYYRQATIQDGLMVARNLRIEDRQEVEGLGHSPLHIPVGIVTSEQAISFHNEHGDLAGVAGIVRLDNQIGQIWMLCTPVIQEGPQRFVRGAKRWLNEVEKEYALLWNLADARNHMHHKLLKLLGFQALQTVHVGPTNLPYYEIVKLCA